MTESPQGPAGEAQAHPADSFDGAAWVGVDRHAMRIRRERQLRRLHFHKDLDLSGLVESPPHDVVAREPAALVRQLRLENFKSLAGLHEIPLAPLTLVFGPNAAGKSAVLNGLKLLRDLLASGRRDALTVWSGPMDDGRLADMISAQAQFIDPEERLEFDSGERTELQIWKRLMLGIDFMDRDGMTGRAELACKTAGHMVVEHSSNLGALDYEDQVGRKEFVWSRPPSAAPWSFGEETYSSYAVRENGAEPVLRVFDPDLFATSNSGLPEDLFALTYFLCYLGPHRGEPADGYEPLQLPFRGRVRAALRTNAMFDVVKDRDLEEFGRFEYLNQMLSQLGVPYEFTPTYRTGEMFEPEDPAYLRDLSRTWHLEDRRSGAVVKLRHVGYGISQLLPVIDACVHARGQVICVEEPELHLHPRLQAKLANLFATAVVSFGNQVIAETHSESMLLRVRRLVREGILRPDDVAVLYVDNGDNGANVRTLRLGARGELLDPWPTGFFDDSLSDVLGVSR